MTKEFKIENVKTGDLLVAHNEDGTLAHSWLVLNNNEVEGSLTDFVEVYVMYAQSHLDERHSFYHVTFKSGAYQKLDWSLESGTQKGRYGSCFQWNRGNSVRIQIFAVQLLLPQDTYILHLRTQRELYEGKHYIRD